MNSEQSWAARVLLWARMRVGRFSRWMIFAMVKVLPDPVTPFRICSRFPAWTLCTRESMAWGWSPVGWKGETN